MLLQLIKAVRVVGLSYKLVSTSLLLTALVGDTLQRRQNPLPKEPYHHEPPRRRKR